MQRASESESEAVSEDLSERESYDLSEREDLDSASEVESESAETVELFDDELVVPRLLHRGIRVGGRIRSTETGSDGAIGIGGHRGIDDL